MWIPRQAVLDVQDIARVVYINCQLTKAWNAVRDAGDLCLMCGWAWISHDGQIHRQGFHSRTACYRDCWYEMVASRAAPLALPAKPKPARKAVSRGSAPAVISLVA